MLRRVPRENHQAIPELNHVVRERFLRLRLQHRSHDVDDRSKQLHNFLHIQRSSQSPYPYSIPGRRGSLQYQYNDTASPVNVTASQTLTASTKEADRIPSGRSGPVDSLETALRSGTGADITDANYDTLGRICISIKPLSQHF